MWETDTEARTAQNKLPGCTGGAQYIQAIEDFVNKFMSIECPKIRQEEITAHSGIGSSNDWPNYNHIVAATAMFHANSLFKPCVTEVITECAPSDSSLLDKL